MRNDLNCPTMADTISPYLDVLDFRFNMTGDERTVHSFYTRNCTLLGGKSAIICKKGIAEVEYKMFANMIRDCHLEQWEAGGREYVFLSKKLVSITKVI